MLFLSKKLREYIIDWCKQFIIAIVFVLFFYWFVILNANVPTGSMQNTIQTPSRNIAFRLSYLFAEPQRHDVVIFSAPDTAELYVKRIIGLPGEVVEIREGKVYINGSETALDDSFVDNPSYEDWGPRRVPELHYFVLGDNRANSHDSREWYNTYVPRADIMGKLVFSYYPRLQLIK